MTRDEIATTARTFIGAKWKHLGRSPKEMDCVGLLALTGDALGIEHSDPRYYEREPQAANFLKRFIKAGAVRAEGGPQVGNIVIFKERAYPCHCGIIASDRRGRLTLIHAYAVARKVVEVPFNDQWLDKVVTYLDFPGVD